MSVAELACAYGAKALSPVEVTRHLLQRLEAFNPALNAFYLVDADAALRDAAASEDRWRRGASLGPLDGVPTSIKDALAAIGWPAYRGSRAHRAEAGVWNVDAPAIARLREAGAIFLGKTTMPDFGILPSGYSSKHGITRNPWDLSLNPGGSSSGASASVAAGITPYAIGTDIVGSVRLPASFCGLYGLKPSYGRIPYYPPNDPALAAGPITRTVEDAAIVMNVVTRPDPRDFTALEPSSIDYLSALSGDARGVRIGHVADLGFDITPDRDVSGRVAEAVKVFETLGSVVENVELSFARDDMLSAEDYYRTRCYAEFMTFDEPRRQAATVIREWTAPVRYMSALALFDAMSAMRRMREQTLRALDRFDYLMLPTVHIPPFAAEDPSPDPDNRFDAWGNTFLFNLTEQPAASVPCGFSAAGAPIGMQIVGHRFDDAGVLRMSCIYEKAVGGFPVPDMDRKAFTGMIAEGAQR